MYLTVTVTCHQSKSILRACHSNGSGQVTAWRRTNSSFRHQDRVCSLEPNLISSNECIYILLQLPMYSWSYISCYNDRNTHQEIRTVVIFNLKAQSRTHPMSLVEEIERS